jgi:hypothetical protein
MITQSLSTDGTILSVHVPIKLQRRGGRKLIIAPPGAPVPSAATPSAKADPTIIKALARGHRWKRLLDTNHYATIKEIAETEQVAARYIGQLLQLTLLAPDLIETLLDGRLPRGITLANLLKPWPARWDQQREHLKTLAEAAPTEDSGGTNS